MHETSGQAIVGRLSQDLRNSPNSRSVRQWPSSVHQSGAAWGKYYPADQMVYRWAQRSRST